MLRSPGKPFGSLQSNATQQDPQGTSTCSTSLHFLLLPLGPNPHPLESPSCRSPHHQLLPQGLHMTPSPASSMPILETHIHPSTQPKPDSSSATIPLTQHCPHRAQVICVISTRRPFCLPESFSPTASWVLRGLARILLLWPLHLLGPSWFPFLPQRCPTQGFALASLLSHPPSWEANHTPSQPALLLCP